MAFSDAWVETDPDGAVIFVSQLDDSDRLIKRGVRERLEGDPASPNLTGLIEVGSWLTAPKPRKGTARVYLDTDVNILAFGADKKEDGRLAFASDTKRLYHVATAGPVEIGYVSLASGGIIASGGLTITAGGLVVTAGGLTVATGVVAFGTTTAPLIGVRIAGNVTNGSGNTQRGVFVDPVAGDDATTEYEAMIVRANTPAVAATFGVVTAFLIPSAIKGAGSGITLLHGLLIQDQTVGVTNYAIYTGLGLIHFGDAIIGLATGNPAANFIRSDNPGGPVLAVENSNALQTLTPYVSFRRAGVEQYVIAMGVNGEMSILCKVNNTVSIRDSGDTIFFSANKGTGAGQVGMNVWDFSAAAIKQVTLGVADSGGVGFKLLRVPN